MVVEVEVDRVVLWLVGHYTLVVGVQEPRQNDISKLYSMLTQRVVGDFIFILKIAMESCAIACNFFCRSFSVDPSPSEWWI